MKTYFECYSCFIKQAIQIAKMTGCNEYQQKQILNKVMKILIKIDITLPPPMIAGKIEKIIYSYSKVKDPYQEIKKKSNDEALQLYPTLKKRLDRAKDKLKLVLKISAFGNVIDFAINNKINLKKEIKEFDRLKIEFKKYNEFKEKIKDAKILLIIGDNAGEIVFDKIFIEYLIEYKKDLKIFYAVREAPILNDATMIDAKYIDLDKICNVITSGNTAPGINLKKCSKDFLDIFKKADIIISKGQGNYESLSENKSKKIYFLLKVKCEVVSRHLGIPIGKIVFI
ncbi:MAG TPA: ARMT1-like domain-containing protein [bacterium]|nr:ARMT1-like domain-containing protein [bacterium]HOL48056.1 ARMT1-like domain-containing protein [bacterium]HPQ19921.1 ARMT1-like domain-containing protein [bacterium]